MSKFFLLAGIVLMGLAFVILFVFLMSPETLADSSTFGPIQTSLFCNPGERVVQELGQYRYSSSTGGGREVRFYCENEVGSRREITGTYVLAGIAGFVVPFLLGLGAFIGSIMYMTGRWVRGVVQPAAGQAFPGSPFSAQPGQSFTFQAGQPIGSQPGQQGYGSTVVHVTGQESELPPGAAEKIQQVLGALQQFTVGTGSTGADLTARLRQLEDARNAGLISEDEYQRVRQQILDEM